MGYFNWYSNFYIFIVGDPGVIKKSTTVDVGMRLLRKVPGIKFGPDAVTWQSLVTSLAESGEEFPNADGEFVKESAITIVSREAGNLLNPQDREMIDLIERTAKVPAVATSPSVVEALRAFGARRISVATPYPEWNNQRLRAYLTAQGFEVLNLEAEPTAAKAGNQGINDQDPSVIVEFASRACRPDADALLCSCTAWRSVEAVEEIERRTGKPVVTSNQSSIWMTLRKLGHTAPIAGFGRLLRSFAAA